MVRLRESISRLMHAVAVVAFPVGVLASVVNNRPILGLGYCLDMGLMPSVPVLLALSPCAVLRGRSRPFLGGFVASGWAAVCLYVASCAAFPDVMARPVLFYVNEVEPRFMEADTLTLYNSMQAKQVKTIFATLDDDTVVRFLSAMQPRTAAKIVKEFKSPEETARIQRVMERMRQNPAAAPGVSASK